MVWDLLLFAPATTKQFFGCERGSLRINASSRTNGGLRIRHSAFTYAACRRHSESGTDSGNGVGYLWSRRSLGCGLSNWPKRVSLEPATNARREAGVIAN